MRLVCYGLSSQGRLRGRLVTSEKRRRSVTRAASLSYYLSSNLAEFGRFVIISASADPPRGGITLDYALDLY